MDIKSGAFYGGIPNYSIKAKDKLPDGKTLLDVIIYDHSTGRGNKTIIMADSSLMYTIMDDRYLKLELYDGHYYSEEANSESSVDRFYRTEYDKMDMVFSLSSFDLKRRKEELFQNNRQMKNISELALDIDSFQTMVIKQKASFIQTTRRYFEYHMDNKEEIIKKGELGGSEKEKSNDGDDSKTTVRSVEASFFPSMLLNQQLRKGDKSQNSEQESDTVEFIQDTTEVFGVERIDITTKGKLPQSIKEKTRIRRSSRFQAGNIDTLDWADFDKHVDNKFRNKKPIYSEALNKARNVKVNLNSSKARLYQYQKDASLYTIEMQKKYAQALACILMFLIGAPLGAIIKKGGLGVPTIIAIFFFIIYYVFTSIGEKQAKEGAMDPYVAAWMSDVILLPFGLFFLRQARVDARLFELDAYRIGIEKLTRKFARNKNKA